MKNTFGDVGRESILNYVKRFGKKQGECVVVGNGIHYATVSVNKIPFPLHRAVAWAHGLKFEDHHVILHSCDVKGCVNIEHLSVGSQSQNMRQAWSPKAIALRKKMRAQGLVDDAESVKLPKALLDVIRDIAGNEKRTIKGQCEVFLKSAIDEYLLKKSMK